jgi:uncharacterized protein (TIGR00297 family)
LIGFILALFIALLAFRLRALNHSGAAAAAVLGTLVFGLGGLRMALLLVVFFITSSLLSRLVSRRKHAAAAFFSKGERRDAGQVLANGGVAGLFLLLKLFFPDQDWPWIAAAAALGAANADTWATELGVLSPSNPRLITTAQSVEPGTSGAISLVGTLAALGGAALIALIAAVRLDPLSFAPRLFFLLTAGGLAGSLIDSLLGATLQAIYRCPTCAKETERHPLHSCGSPTHHLRGLPWLNNDWVNTTCTLSAALIAAVAALAGIA